jgi:hypothetical protein
MVGTSMLGMEIKALRRMCPRKRVESSLLHVGFRLVCRGIVEHCLVVGVIYLVVVALWDASG